MFDTPIPPKQTSVGIISAAIARLEQHPLPPQMQAQHLSLRAPEVHLGGSATRARRERAGRGGRLRQGRVLLYRPTAGRLKGRMSFALSLAG